MKRSDKFIADKFNISRSQAQKIIKKKNIPKFFSDDEDITLEEIEYSEPSIKAENIDLDIIYENEDLVVINKKAGIVVHPAAGHYTNTIMNGLLYHYPILSQLDRAGIVHRLDKETSGLLLVAKNLITHKNLSDQFMNRSIVKIYDCIVYGKIVPYMKIETYLKRQNKKIIVSNTGKYALTECFLQKSNENTSHVKCQIHTGRTHQIRVHMQYINHPIVGDKLYSNRHYIKSDRMLLHASYIEFDYQGQRISFTNDIAF